MNEQLKALLNQFAIEMLNKVKTGIDLASTFLGEQLPLVAQKARAALVPYEKMWLEIDTQKALVNYINKAAERGQDIFPKAIGSGTMLDITQYLGGKK